MSFFDQPYYAVSKANIARSGVWPEQPKYKRIVWPLTMFATQLTLGGPMLIRLRDIWGDLDTVLMSITQLLLGCITSTMLMNIMLKADAMKGMLEDIERHWEMLKDKSAVIVFDKYAERGRYFATLISIFAYTTLAFYLVLSIHPVLLDFLDPLNETRPKDYLFGAEYGVDSDKYYWLIVGHAYMVAIVAVNMLVAFETAYVMFVVHACALFEVVVFSFKLDLAKSAENKKDVVVIRNYCNYRKMCDCIIVHKEAISFAERIQNIFSGFTVIVIGLAVILMSLTGVQVLINLKNPMGLSRAVNYTTALVLHFYVNTIPGQELINHSQKVHKKVYDLNWYHMSVKTQKLWILIMMRSNKPCFLAAGKIYIISMESFSVTMQTALSYFTMLAQLL